LLAQRVRQQVPPSGSSISIEAESLAGSASVSQGRVVPQDMRPFGPGWSGDAQLFWGGGQIGAGLRLSFTTSATGRYEIFLHFTRAPDYAFVQASFDGAPAVSFNGYATTVSRDRALLGMRDVEPGPHEVIVKITMKDGPSKGLNVGLDRIEFVPVATSAPAGTPVSRRGLGGSLAQAAGASMVEGGKPPVPVLHIVTDATADARSIGSIEPMAMSARLSVVQRATSLPVQNAGLALRLTASNPRIPQRAQLSLSNGFYAADASSDGLILVPPGAKFAVSYYQVEANQPHLLDCGVKLDEPAEIRISPYAKAPTGQTYDLPDASKVSLPGGDHHLLTVVVPTKPSFSVLFEPMGTAGFSVRYCEVTSFK
jgi:hypothetical protein